MNDKVNELVEWVGIIIYKETGNSVQGRCTEIAKQILSHPDLALIDREGELPDCGKYRYIDLDRGGWKYDKEIMEQTCPMVEVGYLPVIPLAEALKEVQDEC